MTFYDIANDTNFVYFQIFIWIFTPKLSLKSTYAILSIFGAKIQIFEKNVLIYLEFQNKNWIFAQNYY